MRENSIWRISVFILLSIFVVIESIYNKNGYSNYIWICMLYLLIFNLLDCIIWPTQVRGVNQGKLYILYIVYLLCLLILFGIVAPIFVKKAIGHLFVMGAIIGEILIIILTLLILVKNVNYDMRTVRQYAITTLIISSLFMNNIHLMQDSLINASVGSFIDILCIFVESILIFLFGRIATKRKGKYANNYKFDK